MKENINKYVVHRAWDWEYPIISHSEGIYLYDINNNRYIDGSGGSSVVITIGHGVKEITDAMYEQAKKCSFYPTHIFANEQSLKLGELISENAPLGMRNNCKTWLTCTGTNATDEAVKLARQYFYEKKKNSKTVIITRWQSFHGNSISAAGYSGNTIRRQLYLPMFVDSPHLPPAYCYRCQFGKNINNCELDCAKALEKTICQYGPECVAAFIAEPIVGASLGAVPAPAGYFEEIRRICDKYEVLLICDEVMTGWGRTGKMFGIEHWNVTPDIIATAKGMSSGYSPLAAVIAKKEIWDQLESNNSPIRAGHTLSHNPVSSAVGVAVINYLTKNNLVNKAEENGKYFIKKLQDEILGLDIVGDVRGKGLMLGFEIVKNKKTKEPFLVEDMISKKIMIEAFKRGLIIYPCTGCVDGAAGDMILMAPPLIITKEQIDKIIEILKDAIKACMNKNHV
jgi:adenosylmethionine-8-amino-7-oxononanoate aminotransferase